jgi:hypothetical protein
MNMCDGQIDDNNFARVELVWLFKCIIKIQQ